MNKIFKSTNFEILLLCLLLLFHEIIITKLIWVLVPIRYFPQNIYFLELVNKPFFITYEILILFSVLNLVLLWLISKQFFPKYFSLIAPAIYVLSPWTNYLVSARSSYIFQLLIIQLFIYGMILIKQNHKKVLGIILVTVSSIISMYTSIFSLFLIPLILLLVVILKIVPLADLKLSIFFIILLSIPLLILVINNQPGFKNIINQQITVFKDPGLINSINSYQGFAAKENLKLLSKISQNKYVYFSEYTVTKFIDQLMPVTFFTQQQKLLNFSFSSPIYLGFLIPFIYGILIIMKINFLRIIFFISTLLVIPSVLSQSPVDLNRLVLFSPVVILTISLGLIEMIQKRKNLLTRYFLIVTLFLVMFQLIVTVIDVKTNEKNRHLEYFGESYIIGKQ